MTDERWAECIGGPIDGQRARMLHSAFPWPCGWYYVVTRPAPVDAHPIPYYAVEYFYAWQGEPGQYIDSDHAEWMTDPNPVRDL